MAGQEEPTGAVHLMWQTDLFSPAQFKTFLTDPHIVNPEDVSRLLNEFSRHSGRTDPDAGVVAPDHRQALHDPLPGE